MATILKLPHPTYRDMSPEGLWLCFVSARATTEAIDVRCTEHGRDPTDAEDRDWSMAEQVIGEVSSEFKRRLQGVLGQTVKLDDLMARGVL